MFAILLCLAVIQSTFALATNARNVLIVQNKGGGHGEIGYHLAKKLVGHKVTILQDEFKKSSQPFCQYSELAGVDIVVKKLSDLDSVKSFMEGKKFDTIIDNYNKDVASTQILTDSAKSSGSEYIYISSGGMYAGKCPEGGFTETDEVKADNDCRVIEKFIESSGVTTWTSFRPQYIYGSNTDKRGNIDWFFNRVSRRLPVPLPGDGSQLVALTNCKDVASLIISAIGNPAASNQIFNCGTDKFISYSDLTRLTAKIAGADADAVKIVSYNPSKLSFKPSFPYRASTFTLNPSKAKSVLGWNPAADLSQDLPFWFSQYMALGLTEKAPDLSEDDTIFAAAATA
eukprot:gene6981-14188_t